MSKKRSFLTDPDVEPTDEDWEEITNAAGEKIRAESEEKAKARKESTDPSDQLDSDEQ